MIAVKSNRMSKRERSNVLKGLMFISPWMLGFLVFVLYPTIYSFVISFARYSGMLPPVWLGFGNYTRLFTDPLVGTAVQNTFFYAILAVPIGLVVALLLALAMNRSVKEVAIYRTALYLPSIIPIFAMSFIFIVLVNPQYGLLNMVLGLFNIPQTDYLSDPTGAKLIIVLMAQLGAGNAALIFLAGLNNIPKTMYEAAQIDGSSRLGSFFRITLPLLSPTILFNLITGVSAGLQVFQQAYIMTNGGPANGTLFYMYYLYQNAFSYAQLGYACALAVILFLFGLVLALVLYWLSQRFVNYDAS
ncbi:sugar ABC transporter permease [Dictyobacter sp. S3.2.2.5]|uniref:Sugar ABC transporter permease n=1 Tax=Dictyobacter halimunensis TaxID=3026934 RepID=A0ABQ6FSI4_9CHLR|nr:sugar ABC transporter permease [Dictyobacter sp. S3.2.2.5]